MQQQQQTHIKHAEKSDSFMMLYDKIHITYTPCIPPPLCDCQSSVVCVADAHSTFVVPLANATDCLPARVRCTYVCVRLWILFARQHTRVSPCLYLLLYVYELLAQQKQQF